MRWNPFYNALCATAYIGAVALLMNYIQTHFHNTPDISPIDGMGILSLLVLSAATMAFLFFYHPLIMVIENKRNEALTYFFKTLFIFAFTTAVLFLLIFALR